MAATQPGTSPLEAVGSQEEAQVASICTAWPAIEDAGAIDLEGRFGIGGTEGTESLYLIVHAVIEAFEAGKYQVNFMHTRGRQHTLLFGHQAGLVRHPVFQAIFYNCRDVLLLPSE